MTELPHQIPHSERKSDTEGIDIPGLSLSLSLPPSPHPACSFNNENEIDADSNNHRFDESKTCALNTKVQNTPTGGKNDNDDKCLNLLNPFSLELEEETTCLKREECLDQSLCTNKPLANEATDPTTSPINAVSISTPKDSYKSDGSCSVQDCFEDVNTLPSSRLDKVIHHEPIEESLYSTSPQEKEKQSPRTDNGSSRFIKTTQSPGIGREQPFDIPSDEVEALKGILDLEPGDLEESQLAASDQTAPVPQLTRHAQ